jgi:hypothetical protein
MKLKLVFAFLLSAFIFIPFVARAGFGISPPYVYNENLTRGSHYEQKIVLVRGDPVEDWQAEITLNVPGMENWISVDRGLKFILPEGEKQVPVIVKVDVPTDASYKRYKGNIRVRTTSLKGAEGGKVAIALGGQIDIDLNVSKEQTFDFVVRGIRISDSIEGHSFLWWFVPAKIKLEMQIENKGNAIGSPAKVSLDIYDKDKNVLESVATSKIQQVGSFETKWVAAELESKLKSGGYDAYYKIFKKDGIAQQGETHFTILPYNGSPENLSAAFSAMPLGQKIFFIALVLLIILAVILISKKRSK